MTTYTLSERAILSLEALTIKHHRERDYNTQPEAVYLIYGYTLGEHVVIDKFMECPNAHEDPLFYFGVNKADAEKVTEMAHLEDPALELIGCLHTHEDSGDRGPSWDDIESAQAGTINAVLCVYDRSVSFYDDRGFIVKFRHRNKRLRTHPDKKAVTSETLIAQYPFPATDQ